MPRDTIVLEHSAKDDVLVYRPGRPIQQSVVLRYLPIARADNRKSQQRFALLKAAVIDARDVVAKRSTLSSLSVHDNTPTAFTYGPWEVVCCVRGNNVGTIDVLCSDVRGLLRNKLNELLKPTHSTDRWYWHAARAVHPVVREMRAACKDVGVSYEEET